MTQSDDSIRIAVEQLTRKRDLIIKSTEAELSNINSALSIVREHCLHRTKHNVYDARSMDTVEECTVCLKRLT